MGPSRKKARTKPPQVDEPPQQQQPPPSEQTKDEETSADTSATLKDGKGGAKEVMLPVWSSCSTTYTKQLKSKNSWYGTWPRKPVASTQVARESILADKPTNGSASDLSRFEIRKTPTPTPSVVEQAKEGAETVEGAADAKAHDDDNKKVKDGPASGEAVEASGAEAMEGVDQTQSLPKQPREPGTGRPVTASGWFNWLAATTGQPGDSKKPAQAPDVADKIEEGPPSTEEGVERPVPPGPESVQSQEATKETPALTTSWFGRWSTVPPSTATNKPKEEVPRKVEQTQVDTVMADAPSQQGGNEPTVGSSWAFWSSETSKKTTTATHENKESGQLAVAGQASQNHPEPAKASTVKEKKGKSVKRGRPTSLEEETTKGALVDRSPIRPSTSSSPAPSKPLPPNLLLPSVRSTYNLVENPSILQQIAKLLHIGHQPPLKHVSMAKERPKIKKALAIGIHGLFPATIVRTVIGQPTGTSIKFANHAAAAIRRWTDANGCTNCEIEKAALEGEGKIGERVDNLWKLLLNWIDHVRSADFILVACHSQGVPVAMMLIAKLIEFGVVSNAKIGVCAMGEYKAIATLSSCTDVEL